MNSEHIYEITAANDAIDILSTYHNSPVPKQGNILSFVIPHYNKTIEFLCPEGGEDQTIAGWCLACIFRMLTLDNILLIFAAALTEKQIVFVCENLGVLSATVLSLIPLLRPYVWQGPFIPILPETLYECLQAPVPFVMGVKNLNEEERSSLGNCCVVNIEENKVISPQTGLPEIPSAKILEWALRAQSSILFNSKDKATNPFKTSPQQLELVQNILKEFNSYHEWLKSTIVSKIPESAYEAKQLNINVFVKQFIENKPFYTDLLNSQMFSVFSENVLDRVNNQKSPTSTVINPIDDKEPQNNNHNQNQNHNDNTTQTSTNKANTQPNVHTNL